MNIRLVLFLTLACGCFGGEAESVRPMSKPTTPTALLGGDLVGVEEVASWKAGEYIIVDVRGAEAYEARRIPGAIPVMFERLGPLYPGLANHSKTVPILIVAESDDYALKGAEMLVAGGYDAKGLRGGVDSWISKGLPVEKNTPN